MNTLYRYARLPLFVAGLSIVLFGCKKKKEDDPEPEVDKPYSAMLCVGSWPNTAYYIAPFPSLTSGTIDIKGNGAEMTGKVYAQDVIQRNGNYYHANSGAGRFGKYHVEKGTLIVDKEIEFTYLNWDSYVWINDATLVIIGKDGEGKEVRYAVVKVETMQIAATGKLDFVASPEGFPSYYIGATEYRDGKIFVNYNYSSNDWTNYPEMAVYKKGYVAVIDYASLKVEKNLSFSKLVSSGGPTVYARSSFVDENNDLYFVTDPVYSYNYESPSAVFRIKSGSTEIDSSYYFDYSAAASNEKAPAMWYIGKGKAIVRSRINGQSIDKDHYFNVINVQTGTFIKKLDLPADKGERMVQAVIVENGKAYIAVNGADRDFIYEYNPDTDQLKTGVEFVGGIDYLLRIEKLR